MYIHKYFDPLRLNYVMEMKRSTKKLDDKRLKSKRVILRMWAEHQTSQSTDLLARKKERRNVETRSHWRWSVKPNFQTSTCAFQSHSTMESQTLWSCIYFHKHSPSKFKYSQDIKVQRISKGLDGILSSSGSLKKFEFLRPLSPISYLLGKPLLCFESALY